MLRLSVGLFLIVGTLVLSGCGRTPRTDPAMVDLAVRATVHAMPSPTPRIVEVTRVVEVTRMVEVTRLVEPTATPEPTPTPEVTGTPPAAAAPAAPVAVAAAAEAPVAQRAVPVPSCPAASERTFGLIPITGGVTDHPDYEHGDLNLALRGYVPTAADLTIVNINGPTDSDPPQLAGMFGDGRTPAFVSAHAVRDWNWSCGGRGCATEPMGQREVTLLGLGVRPGEPLSIPSRGARIYPDDFKVLVLYADTERAERRRGLWPPRPHPDRLELARTDWRAGPDRVAQGRQRPHGYSVGQRELRLVPLADPRRPGTGRRLLGPRHGR